MTTSTNQPTPTPPPDRAGPYRSPAAPIRKLVHRVPRAAWIGVASILFGIVLANIPASEPENLGLSDVPVSLIDNLTTFPGAIAELPPATPLAPLLVADAPESLGVLAPQEGATRVVRGDVLTVRFNRPMVRGSAVGAPLATSPVRLEPRVNGAWQWISRSSISFAAEPRAFDRNPEASIVFDEDLASLDGETLYDDIPRVVVFDGSPRLVDQPRQVPEGQPLVMFFDAPVSAAVLGREMFAWESSGRRPVDVRVTTPGFPTVVDPEARAAPRYRVEVTPLRHLEAGAQISIALAPRFDRWSGSYPTIITYSLAPRPRISGIGCEESAWGSARCTFDDAPGQIVDIGPALRILATERLADVTMANVLITPPVPDAHIEVTGEGEEERRVIALRGEWSPDQVYEARITSLSTETGVPLVPLAPLAVRSRGHAPWVEAPSGALAYEHDAPIRLAIRGIHTALGHLAARPVAEGDELLALTAPTTFVTVADTNTRTVALAEVLPNARANRWDRGIVDVRALTGEGNQMVALSFEPTAERSMASPVGSFVQSTDLGITAEAFPTGVLVWLSAVSTGAAIADANIELRSAENAIVAQTQTDATGAAWIRTDGEQGSRVVWNPLSSRTWIIARHDHDRAIIELDGRNGVQPGALGVAGGGTTAEAPAALRAAVVCDRGAYRPGESISVVGIARVIDGASARPPANETIELALLADADARPVVEARAEMVRGRADAHWTLPENTPLGTHTMTMRRIDGTVLGTTTITVAEFRQPTFRVDLDPSPTELHEGEHVSVAASARYLFGAPLENASIRWSITRQGVAPMPSRWRDLVFGALSGTGRAGTLAEGAGNLDTSGNTTLEADVSLARSIRTRIRIEAEVTDGTGQTSAASRFVIAFPAAFEVGLEQRDNWVSLGTELDAGAIAIDHAGEPITNRAIEVRIAREGWHGWWEWQASGGSEDDAEEAGGTYQMRRGQRREVVHTCTLTSALAAVHCNFTPTRAGTYVLEAESRDDAGRTSIAAQRIYVAGADETPDRDPPGAPIALTATRDRYEVGDEAEIAFESPWQSAEALITIHRGSVVSRERRTVGAGGQVIRVPLSDDMVPNVFVTLALIRGRVGEPGDRVDLNAPDLRFGSTSIGVRPARTELTVGITAPPRARPNTTHPITVTVRDRNGAPVAGSHVVLWAVDEGTLRLSSYQAPDITSGFFVESDAAFTLGDLRQILMSRIDASIDAAPSGDGGFDNDVMGLEERERFDPTPLWAPTLITNANGEVSATITLPERPTEYRVMAIAIDDGARSGRAAAPIVVDQPLIVRSAVPRFATEGDHFDAIAFVHNTSEHEVTAQLLITVGDEARAPQSITLRALGELRVSASIDVVVGSPTIPIRFEVRATVDAEEVSHGVSSRVPVVPAARWSRRRAVVGATGERALDLTFGDAAAGQRGAVRVAVASHPFVGLDGMLDALDESWWGGGDIEASRLLALAAYIRMSDGLRVDGRDELELQARAERARVSLLELRTVDGGFARFSAHQGATPDTTLAVLRALIEARAARMPVPEEAIASAAESLVAPARYNSFTTSASGDNREPYAEALRLLAACDRPQTTAADALYEQRELLSPATLAHLALAIPEGDLRRDTLLALAVQHLLPDIEVPGVSKHVRNAYALRDASAFAVVLEAASQIPSGRRYVRRLAGDLLHFAGDHQDGLGSHAEIAATIAALAAAANRFTREGEVEAALAIDDAAIAARVSGEHGAVFDVPWARVRDGQHRLLASVGEVEQPLFVALDARWATPIGEAEEIARGNGVSLHRVFETPSGTPIEPGAHVALGTMIRVRLFVHAEDGGRERSALRDPIGAGFDSVDSGLDTTPSASLRALLGQSPDDEANDPRGYHAERTLSYVEARTLDVHATTYYLLPLGAGLWEMTYAIRATTPGTFVIPPAMLEAERDESFVARSTAATLTVDP